MASAAEAASTSPFVSVDGFATKTGFRGVFSWQTSEPVDGYVRYGTSPDPASWTSQVSPVGVPDDTDTAGLAITDGLTIGKTYWFQVVDRVSGAVSAVDSFVAENAYTSWNGSTYTINMLAVLDSEALPDSVPSDMALEDLADGMNVFAERVYDATDGYVRLGKVLVTDTNLDYPLNAPDLPVGGGPMACPAGNLSDVQVETAPPFDSHTWGGWAIADPCTSFYVGREGQLVTPWIDDLHFGGVAAHELAHYAFNSPDLYAESPQGQTSGADCNNLAWDGSLMSNDGGYDRTLGRWTYTELDRNPTLTPCDMGTLTPAAYSWQVMRQRYTQIPANPTGPIDHVIDTMPRGNADGDAFEVDILDRTPGASTLRAYAPDDQTLGCGGAKPPLMDRMGDATNALIEIDGTVVPNEPSLDILAERLTWDAAKNAVVFSLEVDDLVAAAPVGSTGRLFRMYFSYDGTRYQLWARQELATSTFSLRDSANTSLKALTGQFDVDGDRVVVELPLNAIPSKPVISPTGPELTRFEVLAQKLQGGSIATDFALGSCSYRLGQELSTGNGEPIAVDDTASTDEDASVSVAVLANDTDPDGDVLSLVSASIPASGTATVAGDSIRYTPKIDFSGTDSFTYVVSDSRGGTDTGQVTVTVAPVADPPRLVDDTATTVLGEAVRIPVLANDTSPDGGGLTLTQVTQPRSGTAQIDGDAVGYTPNALFTGRDTFTYTVVDASGAAATATVRVAVVPLSCTTTFREGFEVVGSSTSTTRGWTQETPTYNGIATLNWSSQVDPFAHGPTRSMTNEGVTAAAGISGELGDFSGAKDARVMSPKVPVLPGAVLTFWHRYAFEKDFDGGILEASTDGGATWRDLGEHITSGGYSGTISADNETVLSGRRAWTGGSDGDVSGVATPPTTMRPVTVAVGHLAGSQAQFRWRLVADANTPSQGWWIDDVDVTNVLLPTCPLNTAPIAADDTATTDESTAVTIPVLANDSDPDGDPLSVTDVTAPAHGTVAVSGAQVRYEPTPGYSGADQFRYTVSDPGGFTSSATVRVEVRPVNQAPTAVNDDAVTHEDTAAVIDVVANDTDPDGDALRAVAVGQPNHGTAALTDDGRVRYVPAADYAGSDTFTYTVADPSGEESIASVLVEVSPVNDRPVAAADSADAAKKGSIRIAVLDNDTDVDGGPLRVTYVSAPAQGTVAIEDDGTVTYTPRRNARGADEFSYTVSDGHGGQDSATVQVALYKD